MPRGYKSNYADKQKRQTDHIEEGYEERGEAPDEGERSAWATVDAEGSRKKSTPGRGKRMNMAPARNGGRPPASAARRAKAARSRSAKKGARSRRRRKAA
jgi:hypothetical protein